MPNIWWLNLIFFALGALGGIILFFRERSKKLSSELAWREQEAQFSANLQNVTNSKVLAEQQVQWQTQQTQQLQERFNAQTTQLQQLNDKYIAAVQERENAETTLHAERQAADQAQTEWENKFHLAQQHQKELDDKKEVLMKEQFQVLADKILAEKSGHLQNVNKEQLELILKPLRENLESLHKDIGNDRASRQEISAVLKEQVKRMEEATGKVGTQADNLATALKSGNKLQGNWGEMVLDDLLSFSGLKKGIHYDTQETLTDDSGAILHNEETGRMMRPDVVVHYADGKDLILDSKVSLSAYVDYMNTADPALKKAALDRHLQSVKNHVKELASKQYAAYIKKLDREAVDFVVMFIPNEPSYLLAMQNDPTIWKNAFDQGVLVVSPLNLMALLQLVSIGWKRADQERNQLKILEASSLLLDRLYAFYEDFEGVGKKLDEAAKAFEKSANRLRGSRSVVKKGEELRALGVKMKKDHALPSYLIDVSSSETPLLDTEPLEEQAN